MEGASRSSLATLRELLDQLTAVPPVGDAERARVPEPSRLAEELAAVAALLAREPSVRRALADPGTPAESREGLAERLVGARISADAMAVVTAAVSSRWARDLDLADTLSELAVEALLAEAERDGALDEVEDELFRFGRILDRNPELSLALTDPAAPAGAKRALLGRLLAGRTHPVTVRLAEHAVTERARGDLSRRFERMTVTAAARRDRVVGVVRAAVPLDDERLARLRAAVSRYFGRKVQLRVVVDRTVLGGVVVRVGDEVVDGTVARRLSAARTRLA